MSAGKVPKAPLHDDVCHLNFLTIPAFDLLTASWPCQGNSTCGHKRGMLDSRSSLITEVFRVITTSRPKLVFLENVAGVFFNTSFKLIYDTMTGLGYDFAWTVLKASQVGKPHERKRFFLVACDARLADGWRTDLVRYVNAASEAHLPWKESEPRRTAPRTDVSSWTSRMQQLGNAVVPACSWVAFKYLLNGLVQPLSQTSFSPALHSGAFISGTTRSLPLPKLPDAKTVITVDPAVLPGAKRSSLYSRKASPPVTAPVTFDKWGTPRASSYSPCNTLTVRSMRDIATQVRFDVNTPDDERELPLNPEWIEWMMGFPTGHTSVVTVGAE